MAFDDIIAGVLDARGPRLSRVKEMEPEKGRPGVSFATEMVPSRSFRGEAARPLQVALRRYPRSRSWHRCTRPGSSVVSVPTEQRQAHGSLADPTRCARRSISDPAQTPSTPYQIHEARAHGADLVLLGSWLPWSRALVSLLERTRRLVAVETAFTGGARCPWRRCIDHRCQHVT